MDVNSQHEEGENTENQSEWQENPENIAPAELGAETINTEIYQMTAQQYIIVAPHDGDGAILEPASKYIRIEGEDGQPYFLAIGDISELSQAQIKTAGESIKLEAVEAEEEEAVKPKSKESSKKSASGIGSKRTLSSASTSSAEGVNQTWFTTRDDKQSYQKGGISWKQGQWTKDEIDLLQNNINQYCAEHQITNPREIIFEMSKDDRKDFYRTIARGLQRPLFSVYRRVTRMYDQKNHMGKYTPDEMTSLRELRCEYGNDWAAIGTALGRSASSVKDKCRLMKDNCNAGKWYPEEERRLAQAIYELTGTKPCESVTQGLSWAQVAERVGTRSEKQCRTKWLNYLNWKQQGGADWTRQDDITLIERISKLDVQNDQDIDWNELAKDWPSVRSPQWLRGKWWSLKRHVQEYQELEFRDMLTQLLNMQYQYQNAKARNGVRLTKVPQSGCSSGELPSGSHSEMALHIPISLQSAGLDGSEDLDSFQAFEVLQHWTPNSSTAFLIAQPQFATPVTSDSAASALGDHIIVHTMPITQGDRDTGNVKVQLNPQMIIQAGEHGVMGLDHSSLTIQLPGLHSDQDLHVLTDDGAITEDADSDDEPHTPNQEMIDQESSFEVQQVVSEAVLRGGVEIEAAVSGGDLVMSCGSVSSPPQFTQSSNDAEIIDPLSDPILPSNETDLMGNSSDAESEKVHHSGLEVDLH